MRSVNQVIVPTHFPMFFWARKLSASDTLRAMAPLLRSSRPRHQRHSGPIPFLPLFLLLPYPPPSERNSALHSPNRTKNHRTPLHLPAQKQEKEKKRKYQKRKTHIVPRNDAIQKLHRAHHDQKRQKRINQLRPLRRLLHITIPDLQRDIPRHNLFLLLFLQFFAILGCRRRRRVGGGGVCLGRGC